MLTKHKAMKMSWGVLFLTSLLDGSQWSASRLGSFTPEESALATHYIRGWLGPIAGLDTVEQKKSLPLPGIEPLPSNP
jgi:hypothetical protein